MASATAVVDVQQRNKALCLFVSGRLRQQKHMRMYDTLRKWKAAVENDKFTAMGANQVLIRFLKSVELVSANLKCEAFQRIHEAGLLRKQEQLDK